MVRLLHRLWKENAGQGIIEYAMMMAVVLALVLAAVRMVGSNATTVFSGVASTVQASDGQ